MRRAELVVGAGALARARASGHPVAPCLPSPSAQAACSTFALAFLGLDVPLAARRSEPRPPLTTLAPCGPDSRQPIRCAASGSLQHNEPTLSQLSDRRPPRGLGDPPFAEDL